MQSRSRDADCFHEQCSFFTIPPICITQNWSRISLSTITGSSLIHHICRIWHRVTTICFPDKKRIGGTFWHAGRTHSKGKLDTQKFRGGILMRGDWEASHSAPKVPGSKWWLCRKILRNVSHLTEFFGQFLSYSLSEKNMHRYLWSNPRTTNSYSWRNVTSISQLIWTSPPMIDTRMKPRKSLSSILPFGKQCQNFMIAAS